VRTKGIKSNGQVLFAEQNRNLRIRRTFDDLNDVTLFPGDCQRLLATMPDGCADLIVTSPPYNIGKDYEKRLQIDDYLAQQETVILKHDQP